MRETPSGDRRACPLEGIAAGHEARALALKPDVTSRAEVAAAVAAALGRFGRIDVLVNNAGYGHVAAIEEGDEAQVPAQFETNVFGLIDLTKAMLPAMRARRRGHIVSFSAIVESATVIDDYAATAGQRRIQTRQRSGKQVGDPVRGVAAVTATTPPLRLLLGAPAFAAASA